MKKVRVKDKDIYIVDSHNQVLEAWDSKTRSNVFSLDYHTDTKKAFLNYSHWRAHGEVKAGLFPNLQTRKKDLITQKIRDYKDKRISLSQVNDNLKHDEHLDFAVRTNMIDKAFVLTKNSNETSSNPHVYIMDKSVPYDGQRIVEYSPSCIPGCTQVSHGDECRTLLADSSIEDSFLREGVKRALSIDRAFFDNFIFDIDCDYFNTERSLYPTSFDVFKSLVRRSHCISIALEPVCVKICRHRESLIDSQAIVKRLICLIGEC